MKRKKVIQRKKTNGPPKRQKLGRKIGNGELGKKYTKRQI